MKSVGYILCTDLKESAILISGGSSVAVIPHGIPSEEEVILHGWYFLSAFHLDNQIAIFGPRECVYVFVSADHSLSLKTFIITYIILGSIVIIEYCGE